MWNPANWKHWRLVVKLDPEKINSPAVLKLIVENKPDAVIVGGTQGITYSNTWQLVDDIKYYGYDGYIVQEISNLTVVVNNVDAHLIPIVLNTSNYKWITGIQHQAIRKYKKFINWNKVLSEGYVICNTESAAGRLSEAFPVDINDAVAYVLLAEQLLKLPVLYVEYSGIFGDPLLLDKIARERKNIHIIYGGGISNSNQAEAMLNRADTIVVGNVIYENPEKYLEIFNTVK